MFTWKNFFNRTAYNPISKDILSEYNKSRPLGPQKMLCYSPFRSIYFGHHGKVVSCCYNRTHILGEYPKQSIKEIWLGEEADKLRNYIKHNDLSLGCAGCKQQLVAGNFDAVKAKQYDERKHNKNGFPSVMEFELSNTCNLECEMCSGDFSSLIRAKRENLPPLESPYDDRFVEQLEEFLPYLEEVKFYGGEPFLIEIYYKIWERIMAVNPAIRISVQTNATVLNNRVKRILEGTNFHLNVSFDSLQKETYEKIRKNAEYERTFENLKWFREYCRERDTFFGVSVCAMRQNWRELPDFIIFCNELNVPVYFHTVFYPEHTAIRTMNSAELEEIIKYLSGFSFPANTVVEKKNEIHYAGVLNQIKDWYQTSLTVSKYKGLKIKNWEHFKELVVERIQNDKSQSEVKSIAKIEKICQKMDAVEQSITPEIFNRAIADLDLADPMVFDNVIHMLEQHSAHTLILKAKESMDAA